MSRRRLTLASYVRRRWRLVGAIVVLLLGALLVLIVTDRGHDPVWQAPASELDVAVFAPDGGAVYGLLREDGNISRVVSLRADDGALMWEGPIAPNISSAIVAASSKGAAVATDFPYAFLTLYGKDGSVRWQVPLEGNPIALTMEGEHIALALNAPQNPVLIFEKDRPLRTFHHDATVRAIDFEAGLVAVADIDGRVIVRTLSGETVLNESLAMSPRGLRLSDDGTALVVGGYGKTAADPRGHVAFLDVGAGPALRWFQDTPAGVGLVDIDAAGLVALAVEEAPPSAVLRLYEGSTGATRWTRLLAGSVARDDAGIHVGAALSPDARGVAVGTLRGDVELFDAEHGDERWSYRAGGVLIVGFAEDEPNRLVVGGRLLANRPFDSIFLFATSGEPVGQSAIVIGGSLVALAILAIGLLVGIGFWRARGTY